MTQPLESLRLEFCDTALDFINTELKLMKTFCEMASSGADFDHYKRALRNATKAYQSAFQVFERVKSDLNSKSRSEMELAFRAAHLQLKEIEKTGPFVLGSELLTLIL